jgi:glycolate oxidase iron-sulfur subunit
MLRNDPSYATKAKRIAELTRDMSEYLVHLDLKSAAVANGIVVAYHAACSLQHGQKVVREPRELLARVGFTVREVPEGHLCCGSAGTYNILQPAIAGRLAERKAANIARVGADIIASGNIGCIAQIATATATPIVHTVELIDWATGGPPPRDVHEGAGRRMAARPSEETLSG